MNAASVSAGVPYTETWEPIEYRVAHLELTDTLPSPGLVTPPYPLSYVDDTLYCLGPSKWSVTTRYNGATIRETWTAVNWQDTNDVFGRNWVGQRDDGITIVYGLASNCPNRSGLWLHVYFDYLVKYCNNFLPNYCNYVPERRKVDVQIHPTGLYGGLLAQYGYHDVKWGPWMYKSGIRSIPSSWQVEGEVTNL